MGVKVISAGALTTFQDLGRHGYQNLGVSVGGAMDELSHRIANMLVGNPQDFATLEVTLMGPVLEFEDATLIAISGADLSPQVNGKPVAHERAVLVPAGGRLSFGQRLYGARAYIAVAGGYDVPPVLGSASTALMMGFGGFDGRSLRKGDQFRLHAAPSVRPERVVNAKALQAFLDDHHNPIAPIRVTAGRHWPLFSDDARSQLLSEPYKILPQSNRMGYRLEGAALRLSAPLEAISEPVRFGTMQVPADGRPILLMADRQTVGGYPKIAEVITIDLPKLAQCMPGESIRFELVDIQTARDLYLARADALAALPYTT